MATVPEQEGPVQGKQWPLSPFLVIIPADYNAMKEHSSYNLNFHNDCFMKHLKYYISSDVGIFLLESGSEFDDSEEEVEPQADVGGRDICTCPTLLPANLTPMIAADIQRADSDDDKALRDIASPHFLSFDWRKEPEIFRGVREVFTGIPGPTFPISDIDSPLKTFLKIWDPPIIDVIVRETNRYAQQIFDQKKDCLKTNSRYKTSTPTDANEMML